MNTETKELHYVSTDKSVCSITIYVEARSLAPKAHRQTEFRKMTSYWGVFVPSMYTDGSYVSYKLCWNK
jgi:hypothetical protein